jgi:hypothetical protein
LRTLKSSIKLTLSGTSALDDIFHLINPLVVVNIEAKSQSSVISSLETETHTGLISLNLKPSLKIDKKVKKK